VKTAYRLLLALGIALATPAVEAANPCATGGALAINDGTGKGGTGIRADGTGQGGTGITGTARGPGGDGSGSGGTGKTVEVEGVVTGFASVCVNGLELNYAASTPVTLFGRPASTRDLAIGQVVRALARDRDGRLDLNHIQVDHLMVARVQAVKPGKLLVQGRNIHLSPGAVVSSDLAPGAKLAISGYRDARGNAIATRLDVVPGDTPDSLTGKVERNAQGRLSIDDVVLEGDTSRLKPGDVVRAEGRLESGRMQITRLDREERAVLTDRVVVQGLVRHVGPAGIDVNGQRFALDRNTQIRNAMPRAGEWAIVDAVRERDSLRAAEIEVQAAPRDPRLPSETPIRDNGHRKDVSPADGSPESGSASRRESDADRNPAAERTERQGSGERTERAESHESTDRTERTEQVERTEKAERPEKVEVEKVERVERVEKTERPERIERAERTERPERTERIERPERVERDD
jgi:hypothetical protein